MVNHVVPSRIQADGLKVPPWLAAPERTVNSPLPLETIISGGQTGADQAGLRAGRTLRLRTGGWAPRGFQTLAGVSPALGTDFGLIEHWGGYAARTAANVRDSVATVRLAGDFDSHGERCTLEAIRRYGKPYHDVCVDPLVPPTDIQVIDFVDFIVTGRVDVLNVAGNSERTCPGIGAWVEAFLVRALGPQPVGRPKV